jgi:hypothetical protein
MDLLDTMNLWKSMGHTIAGWKKDDGYYTLFIEHREVTGWVKANSSGFHWDLPESLMKERQRELEVAHEEDKLEGGE